MTIPDYLGERRHHLDAWDDHDPASFDGAFLTTTCVGCGRTINAPIRDTDTAWVVYDCPHSDCQHEHVERTVG